MICRKDACIVVEKMENVRGKNTRRKHLNKTKKKSWRKVNIDQVEDFLEDERLQERTGYFMSILIDLIHVVDSHHRCKSDETNSKDQ